MFFFFRQNYGVKIFQNWMNEAWFLNALTFSVILIYTEMYFMLSF